MPRTTGDKRAHAPSEVVLWIDTYNDLFSDFDPRPFSERRVSEDFVVQLRHAVKEIPQKLQVLKLLVPEKMRQPGDEAAIRRKLAAYFLSQLEQLEHTSRRIRRRGLYFILAGLVCMLAASCLKDLRLVKFYMTFLLTVLEPGGWFLLWTGFDHFMTYSRNRLQDGAFFSRMARVHVEFGSY